jgi:hypothetical protein
VSDGEETRVDEELRALLEDDQALLATAGEVRAAMHEAAIDPEFMSDLRGRVVRERARVIIREDGAPAVAAGPAAAGLAPAGTLRPRAGRPGRGGRHPPACGDAARAPADRATPPSARGRRHGGVGGRLRRGAPPGPGPERRRPGPDGLAALGSGAGLYRRRGTARAGGVTLVSPPVLARRRSRSLNASTSSVASNTRLRRPMRTGRRIPARWSCPTAVLAAWKLRPIAAAAAPTVTLRGRGRGLTPGPSGTDREVPV